MTTIRHSFSKYPPRPVRGSRSRTLQRSGTRIRLTQKDAEAALRAKVQRPLGELTHRHTRTRWIIDEVRP